jgi:hypothetical protein
MSRAGRKELQFDYIGPDPYEDNIFYFSQVHFGHARSPPPWHLRARTHTQIYVLKNALMNANILQNFRTCMQSGPGLNLNAEP